MQYTQIPLALSYNDVQLVPQYNNVDSRLEPSLETWLTKNTKVAHPLIPANMDRVICDELADELIKSGGIPIFHRFTTFEQQLAWSIKYNEKCFISCGVGTSNDSVDKIITLLDAGARGVCLDIAHAHSKNAIQLIYKLKKERPNKEIIAGNVCTAMGYQDLVNAGADAVKVGIGGGCFGADTKILMASGSYKNICDVAIGNKVINMHGKPVNVIGIANRGTKDVIKLRTNAWHEPTIVTMNHQYLTYVNGQCVWKPISECSNVTYPVVIDTRKIKKYAYNEYCNSYSITSTEYAGFVEVFDIEVDCPTHSFIANGAIVHNSACATTTQTGYGVPYISSMLEISKIANKLRVPCILDGGITYPGDIAKAIAAGASCVMMGRQFAAAEESAAPKFIGKDNRRYAHYRGQASKEFQKDFYGGLKKGTVPEGISMDTPVTGTTAEVIETFCGGFRSALTYGGARDIKEFQRKAEFVRVTPSGFIHGMPRSDSVQLDSKL